jgi:hypothetical protein
VLRREKKHLVIKLMPKLHAEDASCVRQHARLGSDNQGEPLQGFSKTENAQDELISTMVMFSSSAFHLSVSLTSHL